MHQRPAPIPPRVNQNNHASSKGMGVIPDRQQSPLRNSVDLLTSLLLPPIARPLLNCHSTPPLPNCLPYCAVIGKEKLMSNTWPSPRKGLSIRSAAYAASHNPLNLIPLAYYSLFRSLRQQVSHPSQILGKGVALALFRESWWVVIRNWYQTWMLVMVGLEIYCWKGTSSNWYNNLNRSDVNINVL